MFVLSEEGTNSKEAHEVAYIERSSRKLAKEGSRLAVSQVDEFDASFQRFLTPEVVTFVTLHPHQDSIRSFARWR